MYIDKNRVTRAGVNQLILSACDFYTSPADENWIHELKSNCLVQKTNHSSLSVMQDCDAGHVQNAESTQNALMSGVDLMMDALRSYAFVFNRDADSELFLTVTPPAFECSPRSSSYASSYKGRVSARSWSLIVGSSESKIRFTLLPAAQLFLAHKLEESANSILELSIAIVNGQIEWSYLGEQITVDLLCTIAKDAFKSLVEAIYADIEANSQTTVLNRRKNHHKRHSLDRKKVEVIVEEQEETAPDQLLLELFAVANEKLFSICNEESVLAGAGKEDCLSALLIACASASTSNPEPITELTENEFTNVESTELESTKAEFTNVESTELESTKAEFTNVESTELESTKAEFTNVESTELESTNTEISNVESIELESTNAQFPNAESTDVKFTNVESIYDDSTCIESANDNESQAEVPLLSASWRNTPHRNVEGEFQMEKSLSSLIMRSLDELVEQEEDALSTVVQAGTLLFQNRAFEQVESFVREALLRRRAGELLSGLRSQWSELCESEEFSRLYSDESSDDHKDITLGYCAPPQRLKVAIELLMKNILSIGSRSFENKDFDRVQKACKHAIKLQKFQKRVGEICGEDETLLTPSSIHTELAA